MSAQAVRVHLRRYQERQAELEQAFAVLAGTVPYCGHADCRPEPCWECKDKDYCPAMEPGERAEQFWDGWFEQGFRRDADDPTECAHRGQRVYGWGYRGGPHVWAGT